MWIGTVYGSPRDERSKSAPPLPPPSNADVGRSEVPRPAAIIGVLGALVLVVIDSAIANVALPTIGRALAVSPAQSVLIVTAYQLGLVVALLPSAALGESHGYRRVFVAGIMLFTSASVLCALSPSLPVLVVARFVQGLGGSAIMWLSIALLRQVVPQTRLGAAIGWHALTIALSSAAGPTIGAFILSALSWPWLFAVNLPIGATVLLLSRALPHSAGSGQRLDAISASLNAFVFGTFVFGAELLPSRPSLAAALLLGTAFGLTALIRREIPRQTPLIPIDLLRAPSFRTSIIASVWCFTGQTAGFIALPFYLQHGLDQSALTTGLLITPWPLTVAATAPIAGRLADRIPGAWITVAGCTALATGLAGIALWPHAGHPAVLVPFIMLCGFGFGLFQVSNNRNMFLTAPPHRSGAAGGIQGTARLFGQTVGAVIVTLLFTLISAERAPQVGLLIGDVLTLMAGMISARRLALRSHLTH